MDRQFADKTALVTGAGRGIGRAICKTLQNKGARVIPVARTATNLAEISDTYFVCDLFEEENVEKLIADLKKASIEPDIVVHNVGGNLGVTNPICSIEEWKAVMRINVEVAIQINAHLLPGMQERKWGRICHTSSISALENQGPPSYCAAKAALIAYVRSVGRYFAKDNVVMTSVLPGAIFTEGGYWDETLKNRPEHVESFLQDRMAIQRFGRPEEISELVSFLCSEQASFCVGTSVLADGGQGRVFYDQTMH